MDRVRRAVIRPPISSFLLRADVSDAVLSAAVEALRRNRRVRSLKAMLKEDLTNTIVLTAGKRTLSIDIYNEEEFYKGILSGEVDSRVRAARGVTMVIVISAPIPVGERARKAILGKISHSTAGGFLSSL